MADTDGTPSTVVESPPGAEWPELLLVAATGATLDVGRDTRDWGLGLTVTAVATEVGNPVLVVDWTCLGEGRTTGCLESNAEGRSSCPVVWASVRPATPSGADTVTVVLVKCTGGAGVVAEVGAAAATEVVVVVVMLVAAADAVARATSGNTPRPVGRGVSVDVDAEVDADDDDVGGLCACR